jgi:chromosome segregation ATPase
MEVKDMQDTTQNTEVTEVRSGGKAWKIVGGIAIAGLIGFNVHLMNKMSDIEASSQSESAAMTAEVSDLQATLSAQKGEHQREISALQESVETTKAEAAARARSEASRRSDELAKTIAAKQREQQDMFLTEIGSVRGETDTNRKGIEDVNTQVVGVQGELDKTRENLSETADLLASTQKDVDGISGRVGDHDAAIERLKMQGQRDVTKFQLPVSKERTKVEAIQMRVKDIDYKKNRYTLEVLADDKVVTHKDRLLNEPVEFYVMGVAQPYEVVVTDIERNQVTGYLATPKFKELARN